MIRTVLAVITGYLVIAGMVFVSQTLVGILNGTNVTVAFANLLLAMPNAILGGYTAARIARDRAMAAAIGLAAVSVAMAILSFQSVRGRQPLWYWCALMALLASGSYYGGFIRKRQTLR